MVIEVLKYLKARYVSEKAQGIVEYALILAFVTIIAAALMSDGGIQGSIQKVIENVDKLLGKSVDGSTAATTPKTK